MIIKLFKPNVIKCIVGFMACRIKMYTIIAQQSGERDVVVRLLYCHWSGILLLEGGV